MTSVPEQPESHEPDGRSGETPDRRRPRQPVPPAQPMLKCPFCSGKRFDFGRDVYAGPDQAMYCRKTPPPGEGPEEGFSLPMKGAVCLDCGYVAMMVDINQLHAPIPRPTDAASALARQAGAVAHLARSPEDEAAEALGRMGKATTAEPPGPLEPQRPEAPPNERGTDDVGFGDLGSLLDEAEKLLGLDRKRPRD